MRKLTFIALLFISLGSFAQNKFIEVEVTDTISLKPLNFQCNVYANDDDVVEYIADDVEEYDPLAAAEKSKNKLQSVKLMLESKKYKVLPLDESKVDFLKKWRASREGFTIIVNGEAEMQKLKALLSSNKDVTTSIFVSKYADELKAEEQLIKKLIDKAKARAAVIGVNSGLKTGRILEVKEGKVNDASSLNDLYIQMAKMSNFGESNGNYTGSLSKTFVVKFAAE